ncbi:MAG: Ferrous-iron efflux pump FieF [bacterium ADurb.BinA186]|nr:MAG: Ferrous-iron efflux pump FieF [bacterium ADurb.BinA186]
MVTWLRKLFVKDYEKVDLERVRASHGKLAAWFGIITNFLIAGMKLAIAIILAAQDNWVFPMALIADSVNNFSDMGTSLVTLVGFKMASKPADKEHPFGHERIEYIAGLIVAMIVVVLAVELFRDSLTKIIDQATTTYDLLAIIILGVSIVLKLFQSYVNRGLGKAINSLPLKATAVDSFTDSIATTLILISAILSKTMGWNFLDGYMGVAVSLFVAYSGIRMMKETMGPLIGEAQDKDFVNKIVHDVMSHPEIKGVHDVLCHSYGPTKYFVSLHAEVDQNQKLTEIHDVIDNVEEEIKKKYGCDITIHMDPIAVGDPIVDALKAEVKDELQSISTELKFHDFRIVKGPTHTNIIFDVVLPFDQNITEPMVRTHLQRRFENRDTQYKFVIHFDRPFTE